MYYSLEWIKDFIPIDLEPKKVVSLLTNLGLNVDTWWEEEGDILFDLEITPNRPDAMSHLGIARELAAALNLPLSLPHPQVEESDIPIEELTSVVIKDPMGCPRYVARVFTDVTIADSPPWIAERLKKIGFKPINNVVDATNYCLAAIGQPLHAFDYDRLKENRIIVRSACQGEAMTTLDGQKRNLTSQDLVIADAKEPVALAGIMGGEATEVTPYTQTILLESAYFHPLRIRKTLQRLNLITEASQRFSRGADPMIPPLAADLCAEILIKQGTIKVAKGVWDLQKDLPSPQTILLTPHFIRRYLGETLAPDFVQKLFQALGCHVKSLKEGWEITPPSFRHDLKAPEDLIEELARHKGYQNIPTKLPVIQLKAIQEPRILSFQEKVRDLMVGCGCMEVMAYPFTDGQEKTPCLHPWESIKINNPLSSASSHLRKDLWIGLVRTARENLAHKREDLALFDLSKCYGIKENHYQEHTHLGILLHGYKDPPWENPRRQWGAQDIKGMVELLLQRLGYGYMVFEEEGENRLAFQGKGEKIGHLGNYQGFWLAEICLDTLLSLPTQPSQYSPIPQYPPLRVDMTLVHPVNLHYKKILDAIDAKPIPCLEEITWKGRFFPEGEASREVKTTLSLTFRAPDRSLTQEEVNQWRDELFSHLAQTLPIRGG